MKTVYVVPAGTRGKLQIPGCEPEPQVTPEDFQTTAPPLLVGSNAMFKYAGWLLSVPRSKVVACHQTTEIAWDEWGV